MYLQQLVSPPADGVPIRWEPHVGRMRGVLSSRDIGGAISPYAGSAWCARALGSRAGLIGLVVSEVEAGRLLSCFCRRATREGVGVREEASRRLPEMQLFERASFSRSSTRLRKDARRVVHVRFHQLRRSVVAGLGVELAFRSRGCRGFAPVPSPARRQPTCRATQCLGGVVLADVGDECGPARHDGRVGLHRRDRLALADMAIRPGFVPSGVAPAQRPLLGREPPEHRCSC